MNQNPTEWTSLTAEDRERLGVCRNRAVQRMKKVSIIATIVSIIAIGIGIAIIVVSDYYFYKVNGPLITGGMTLLLALVSIGLISEGRKYPSGDETGGCFRCWVACYLLVAIFSFIGAICPIVFCVFAIVYCRGDAGSDELFPCGKNHEILFPLSILSLIFILILSILTLIGVCSYCCNTRAFGIKGRHEQMLEAHMLMFSEMQSQQMQAAASQQGTAIYPPAATTGHYPGSQPVQSHLPTAQQHPCPSAPPAIFEEPLSSRHGESGHNIDSGRSHRKVTEDSPPSYYEVMKK